MATDAVASTSIIDYKTYTTFVGKDIDNPNLPRTQIVFAIDAVSDFLRQYLRRKIISATIEDIFYGNGEMVYYVENGMISSITTLYYWESTDFTEMSATTYPREIDGKSPDWDTFVRFTEGDVFSKGIKYKLKYVSGWARASVPASLQGVTAILVQRWLKNAQGTEGMASESAGASSSVLTLQTMFDDKLKQLVAPFKVV